MPSLQLHRDARLFAVGPDRVKRLSDAAEVVRLAGGEIIAPTVPSDLVVRQGNLRVSERLPDGREVTRAVLQTGAMCRVSAEPANVSDTGDSPLYSLEATTLEALGEAEVWTLPPGLADAT